MKPILLATSCILFLLTSIHAQQDYNILKDFRAPTRSVGDLTYDGTHLWLADREEVPSRIYKISPITGKWVARYDLPNSIGGIAYGEKFLWISNHNLITDARLIYKVNPNDGTIIDSIPFKNNGYTDTFGMQYLDGFLYLNLFREGVVKIDTSGDTLNTQLYRYPPMNSHAITHDGCQWLITANGLPRPNFGRLLYLSTALDTIIGATADTLSSLPVPGESTQVQNFPNGLTWDDTTYWLANNQSDRIYRLEIVSRRADTACNFFISPSGNFTWDTSGVYQDILTNSNGCDSILEIDLTIKAVNDSIERNENTLTLIDSSSATYQWINCTTMLPINGATSRSFTPDTSGVYAVEFENNGSKCTSKCIQFFRTGLYENPFEQSIKVFPNPVKERLFVDWGANHRSVQLSILDVNGRQIQLEECSNCQNLELNPVFRTGFYFLLIETENKRAFFPLIKE